MSDNRMIYAASLCAAATFAILLRWRQRSAGRLPYPPGPRGYPLIGNVLDVPRNMPIWKGFISLAEKFNTDVLYLKLFSTDFVVLNSSEAICDLTEKRSNIYSDRPTVPMLELMDVYSWSFVSIGYGSKWRRRRRLFHESFNMKAVMDFDDHQHKHACRFLLQLAETPEEFLDHAQFATGALIMDITYGLDIKSHNDKFLQAAEHATQHIERALVPGTFLVDTFPILKHIPEWFPGAGFKTFAKEGRRLSDVAVDGPLEYVKESLKTNGGNISFASSCFDRVAELQNQSYDESDIRAATSTAYIAAADTTLTVLKSFFLMMALYPHVARKAQEELDRVVGNERLPELSDQENLPYISALMKELLRWGCPLPFGLPKRVTEDDVYNGFHIPAGANIVENVWAVCYDETVYPEPQTYDPERFLKNGRLDSSVKDPEDRVFGSGRRICPGRHFALRTLFLDIACTLSAFDILPPVDEKLEVKYSENLIRHPLPFKCVIKPRSAASLKLVRDAGAIANHS